MKKYGLFITVVCVLASVLYSCQGNKKGDYVIAIIPKVDNQFFDEVKESALQAGKDCGVTITWETPTSNDGSKQVELIENMIKYKVDAILISCNDEEMLKEPINKAIKAGIKVGTFDSDCPESERSFYVGTDNKKAGEVCAATMTGLFEKVGKKPQNVIVLSSGLQATNMKERMSGFVSKIGAGNIVDVLNSFEMVDYGIELLSMSLTKNKKIEGIQMISGLAAQKEVDSIPALTKFMSNGGISVFFDSSKPLLKYIKGHANCATMQQDFHAMGYNSVKNMYNVLTGKAFEKQILFDVKVIDPSNVDKALEELK